MSNVPISMKSLEDITTQVAQELLESWAIDDRFEENDIEKATQNAVDDTVLVINSFMEKMNDAMIQQPKENKLVL